MARVDIEADLNSYDETGLVWTLLDEAPNPELIHPGAVVIAGTSLAATACRVVDLVEKPVGTIVHLEVLPSKPGTNGDNALSV